MIFEFSGFFANYSKGLNIISSYIYKQNVVIKLKYKCDICGYIYDPETGDEENNIKAGIDFYDLPSDWVCPRCGIDMEQFVPVDKISSSDGEGPMALMILALTNGLWNISGRGSYSVTREIGRVFVNELRKEGVEFKNSDSSFESVKDYFFLMDQEKELNEMKGVKR